MSDLNDTPPTPLTSQSSLRPYAEGDLDQIVAIEAKVHSAPWTRKNFEGELEKPYSSLWVLTDDESDSQILGYVVFWNMTEAFEILNVVVDLPYRGLGLGTKIMRGVVNHALRAGATRLILDVRKSNTAALVLYQKLGFTISQIRKGFYSNGEDAYHMTLGLEGVKVEF